MLESAVAVDRLFFHAFADSIEPPRPLSVSQWAAQNRMVSEESGSPYPGRWRNERVPYLAKVMDCCGLDDPCREVVFVGGAQSGKSEVGLNVFGYTVDYAATVMPSPMLIFLPSIDEALKYNRAKLQTTIEATPTLAQKIADEVSRSSVGSTAGYKKFPGGYCIVAGANSSKALQMVSVRVLICEEVSEYPASVGQRGEPLAQADARTKAYLTRKAKRVYISTPGLKGSCRITAKYEQSDQHKRYVRCPHCGWYQVLSWPRMRWEADRPPYRAWFECAANGCAIDGLDDRKRLLAAGEWFKTFAGSEGNPPPPPAFDGSEFEHWQRRPNEGLQPGFQIWQAYNPGVPWDDTVDEYHKALGNPATMKTFVQQGLGEPWEERGDAPDAERLVERRQAWPARSLPPQVLFLTGATDVQQDRLEWAVYGWDRMFGCYLIDFGMIMGSPEGPEPWKKQEEVVERRYRDAWGRSWPVDLWGVDAGYLSQQVYRFVSRYAQSGKVMALDGREGWKLPAIGTPSVKDVDYDGRKKGAVQLWPVGTWDLKSEIYHALRLTLDGADADGIWKPGAAHFSERTDLAFFQQLTAEVLIDRQLPNGTIVKRWVKTAHRNEQHDLAVYARALARHATQGLDENDWQHLAAERSGDPATMQADLASIWAPQLRDVARQAETVADLSEPSPSEASDQPPAVIDERADDYWAGWH